MVFDCIILYVVACTMLHVVVLYCIASLRCNVFVFVCDCVVMLFKCITLYVTHCCIVLCCVVMLLKCITVLAWRHLQAHVCVSTHVEDLQHERKIARANSTIIFAG